MSFLKHGVMKKKLFRFFIVACLVGLLFSCNAQAGNTHTKELADTVMRDIPLDKKGKPTLSYLSKVQIAAQLKLDTLENGFDSLQIRIWYGYARTDSGQLVIIKNINNKWTAELFTLLYHLNENGNTLKSISKNVVLREPNSGWENFTSNLFELQIMGLPDFRKIINYPDIADGNGVSIEIATTKQYRYYLYQEPKMVQDKIKQAKKIEEILELIEDEFNFKRLRKL